ncbi:ABC transporter permease [Alicyclobacillus kakegawensis]|uniref:ABC transporter permease n=1 Tax=Alicyclobacillus kakegawensis TaxID=392012 RepID=UPI0008378E09|nr:ABC transporter permease [Alicyclobacillus kakegawensis]
MRSIIRKELKLLFRSRGNLFFLVILPMLFIALFGSVFSGSAPAGAQSAMLDQVVPGYTVMFVFFIILSMMRRFMSEKESGILARLMSTPLQPLTYLVGMWVPAIITVLIQCTVLLAFGHLVYHVHLGNLLAMAVIVLCLAICGTGIGLAVSLLARGENHGRGITMLITLGGAALGGLWVPESMLPHFARVLSHFTPQYWAQQGFQQVMAHGGHTADVVQSLAVLLAFGAAGLVVALWRFPRYLRVSISG